MASRAQTIANRGLHHDPYYVEKITNSSGKLLYQHKDAGTQVLTPEAADTVVSILKGVLTKGTARAVGPVIGHPSAGKTGTQVKNTNAWFIGFTPALTTSVWVGDPKGYTSMTNIPEFRQAGVGNVQGATFPARIWKAYMDPALVFQPPLDWPEPPAPTRKPGRLYLPGNECLARSSGGGQVIQTPGTLPDGTPDPNVPEVTAAPSLSAIDSGTTVPSNVLDPYWPLPIAPAGATVYNCAKGLPLPPPAPEVTRPPDTTVAAGPPQTQTGDSQPAQPPVTQPPATQTAQPGQSTG
jgi:penicillin-binding protein 1A